MYHMQYPCQNGLGLGFGRTKRIIESDLSGGYLAIEDKNIGSNCIQMS